MRDCGTLVDEKYTYNAYDVVVNEVGTKARGSSFCQNFLKQDQTAFIKQSKDCRPNLATDGSARSASKMVFQYKTSGRGEDDGKELKIR